MLYCAQFPEKKKTALDSDWLTAGQSSQYLLTAYEMRERRSTFPFCKQALPFSRDVSLN